MINRNIYSIPNCISHNEVREMEKEFPEKNRTDSFHASRIEYKQENNFDLLAYENAEEITLREKRKKNLFTGQLFSMSGLLHDLKNSAGAIVTLSENILSDQKANEERMRSMEYLLSAGRHMLQISRDLSDYYKMTDFAPELKLKELCVRSLIHDVIGVYRFSAKIKGIRLMFMMDLDISSRIRGDEVVIRRMLENILSNSVREVQTGWILLKINKPNCEGDGIVISVVDTGPGIPDCYLLESDSECCICTPDRRVRGLGLSLVREMANMMDYSVHIQNYPELPSPKRYKPGAWIRILIPAALTSEP